MNISRASKIIIGCSSTLSSLFDKIWPSSAQTPGIFAFHLFDHLWEFASRGLAGADYGRIRWSNKWQISKKIAKISILELVVSICVHVCKDLQNHISFKANLQLVDHISKVWKVDLASCAEIKGPESWRNFAKFIKQALSHLGHWSFELDLLLIIHLGIQCSECTTNLSWTWLWSASQVFQRRRDSIELTPSCVASTSKRSTILV